MRLPEPTELPDVPLHVLLRDFPEALAVVRSLGIDARILGAQPLAAAAGAGAAALYEALRAATSWRDEARRPCDPGPTLRALPARGNP